MWATQQFFSLGLKGIIKLITSIIDKAQPQVKLYVIELFPHHCVISNVWISEQTDISSGMKVFRHFTCTFF